MKLLADECCDVALVEALRADGQDVLYVAESLRGARYGMRQQPQPRPGQLHHGWRQRLSSIGTGSGQVLIDPNHTHTDARLNLNIFLFDK